MLPKGLYDALPWLYMAGGGLVTAVLESDLKFLPALLFFLAGGMVFLYRRAARGPARHPTHHQAHPPAHHVAHSPAGRLPVQHRPH